MSYDESRPSPGDKIRGAIRPEDYAKVEPYSWERTVHMDKKREWTKEFAVGGVVYALMLTMVIVWIVTISKGRNFSFMEGGDLKPGDQCGLGYGFVNQKLCDEIQKCRQNSVTSRRLQSTPTIKVDNSVFGFMQDHWYMPFVIVLSCTLLCCVWLVLIWKWALIVIWTTIGATIAVLIATPIIIKYKIPGAGLNWPFFVMAGLYAIFMLLARHKINVAAQMAETSMDALFSNCHVIIASILTLAGELVLLALTLTFYQTIFNHRTVSKECDLALPSSFMLWGFFFLYFVCRQFFKGSRLMAMTASYAGWYFNEECYSKFCWSGLAWSFGPLAGANGLAALINGFMEWISAYASGNCFQNFMSCQITCDYMGWCLSCFLGCIGTCLEGFTTWGLMAVTFTGEPMLTIGKPVGHLMINWFGDAIVTNYVGRNTIGNAFFPITVAAAFAAWGWSDGIDSDVNTFKRPCAHVGGGDLCPDSSEDVKAFDVNSFLVLFGVWIVFVILVMPFRGCLFILLFSMALELAETDCRFFRNVLIGSFMGYVATILVDFVVDMVANGMNICMFCFAIEQETGGADASGRFAEFQSAIGVMYGDAVIATAPPYDHDSNSSLRPETVEMSKIIPRDGLDDRPSADHFGN